MEAYWPFGAAVVGLLGGVAVLLSVGVKLVGYADAMADRFRLGEALMGGLMLGGVTSLSGSIVSGLAAYNGLENLAINNCLGGIAAQTTFLIVADLTYRKVNLEHAAASLPNLVSCNLLIALLGLVLIGQATSNVAPFFIHPVSPLIFILYVTGLKWLKETYERPLWLPKRTKETRLDEPEEDYSGSRFSLLIKFLLSATAVGAVGYVITKSAESLVAQTGISESFAGAFITAVITSLPELVVSIMAVRRGALTMAVANILGGNAFDVLMLVVADLVTFNGPIYAHFQGEEMFLAFVNILMTSIIAIGLARRQKTEWGAIGFEGMAILVVYAASFAVLTLDLAK